MHRYLFFLAAALIAGFLPAAPAFAHSASTTVHTISMQRDHFVPAEISINDGDTVVFRNDDAVPHWPASNIHPTHTIYPEFDPKQGVVPGSSWSFIFVRAGHWRFHDHLHAEVTGTIHVAGDSDASARTLGVAERVSFMLADADAWMFTGIFAIVPRAIERYVIASNDFTHITSEGQARFWLRVLGPDAVMAKLLADTAATHADCHEHAHIVGHAAYQLYGAQAFSFRPEFCHSGYIHGVMETFLSYRGGGELAADIIKVCDASKNGFDVFQ